MANRTDPLARSVHGTNPQVHYLKYSKSNCSMSCKPIVDAKSILARQVSSPAVKDRHSALQPDLVSACRAEFGGEDPSHEDMAVDVLEGALLWSHSRVTGRQGRGAHSSRRHLWRSEEAHELHVSAAQAAAAPA